MAISMYHASVPVFVQLLGGLKGVIEKAEAHANAHKWEENTILNYRLYPDMFTFARQVRQASEHAFGAGRAAGVEVPNLPAIDNSFGEMKARIDNTIDFLEGLKADQLDGREGQQVTITAGGQPRTFRAQIYLYHFAMPNFYFHITTAYNIARSLGIEIGKRDFIGEALALRPAGDSSYEPDKRPLPPSRDNEGSRPPVRDNEGSRPPVRDN